MVPVFEITVKTRPATAINLACFKLHLRAREDPLLACSQVDYLGEARLLHLPFRLHQKVLVALLSVDTAWKWLWARLFNYPGSNIKKT